MKKWFDKNRRRICELCDRVFDFMGLLVIALYVTNLIIAEHTGKQSVPVLLVFYICFTIGMIALVLNIILGIYNKKRDRRKIYSHNIAANFLDIVEGVLDEYDITIPDKEREGNPDEARLYGEIYDRMLYLTEISVVATLNSINGVECELITDVFE